MNGTHVIRCFSSSFQSGEPGSPVIPCNAITCTTHQRGEEHDFVIGISDPKFGHIAAVLSIEQLNELCQYFADVIDALNAKDDPFATLRSGTVQ